MSKRHQECIFKGVIIATLAIIAMSCLSSIGGMFGDFLHSVLVAAFGFYRIPLAVLLVWLIWILANRQCKMVLWLYAVIVFFITGAALSIMLEGGFGYLLGNIGVRISKYIGRGIYILAITICSVPFLRKRRTIQRKSDSGNTGDVGSRLKTMYETYIGNSRLIVDDDMEQRNSIQVLQEVLDAHGVLAKVVDFKEGYTAIKYFVKLEPGTTYSKITRLSDEISLAFGATGITFGKEGQLVTVSTNKAQSQSPGLDFLLNAERESLAALIGVDTNGQIITTDLFGKTHMIVGGGSGSGKTTLLYSLLLGLALANSPADLEMIIIDGKSDLVAFRKLPHLVMEICFDYDIVNPVIDFVTNEMERRRRTKIASGQADFKPLLFLIEEIDTVLQSQGKNMHFKEKLTHLSRQARSVNILLILTSQNPTKKTIDSNININYLSRLCLLVESMTESQVILGQGNTQGSQLNGAGDLWFKNNGKLTRGKGFYITEKEVYQKVSILADKYKSLHDDARRLPEQTYMRGINSDRQGIPQWMSDFCISAGADSDPVSRKVIHLNRQPLEYAVSHDIPAISSYHLADTPSDIPTDMFFDIVDTVNDTSVDTHMTLEELEDRIYALLDRGYSYSEIKKETGANHSRVQRTAKKWREMRTG